MQIEKFVAIVRGRRLRGLLLGCVALLWAGQAPAHATIPDSTGASGSEGLRLIPEPVFLQAGSGNCDLSNGCTLSLTVLHGKKASESLRSLKALLQKQLHTALGNPQATAGAKNTVPVQLNLDPALKWRQAGSPHRQQQDREGYQLEVSAAQIRIAARTPAGLYYGMQSLLQLAAQNKDRQIPAVTVEDFPQYSWRGFMLDVSRHFTV